MIAYLVINGFSLFDIRKLYIDELFFFYDETIYTLEKLGKVKEGEYDKIVSSKKSKSDNTVNLLRRQLFKSLADKK